MLAVFWQKDLIIINNIDRILCKLPRTLFILRIANIVKYNKRLFSGCEFFNDSHYLFLDLRNILISAIWLLNEIEQTKKKTNYY